MSQSQPRQIHHALQWAQDYCTDAAAAAADWLARDILPSVCSAVELLTSSQTSLTQLEQAKDAYKTMRVLGETAADRRIGGRLYLASIAAGLVLHGKRISRQSDRALGRALHEMATDEKVPQRLRMIARDALDRLKHGGGANGNQQCSKRRNVSSVPLEIERTYLLNRLPKLPPEADAVRIEQGYLCDDAELDGRLRREVHADGTVRCTHTIKSGKGLVRQETERTITEAEFIRHWPATSGHRLSKVRYRVPVGELIWEIDSFNELSLVLAEVELPAPDTPSPPPPWLETCIVREVTEEKQYRNHELARRLARGEGVDG